ILLVGGLLTTAFVSVYFKRQVVHAAQLEAVNHQLIIARDEALEAARLKSQFLANMSHEIRTPMNGLLGLTELALASPLSPEQAELLQTAYSSGRTLLELLNNVLDLTRADAGKMLLERVPFAVRDEIETVIRLFAEQARVKDIALRL